MNSMALVTGLAIKRHERIDRQRTVYDRSYLGTAGLDLRRHLPERLITLLSCFLIYIWGRFWSGNGSHVFRC